MKTTFIHQFYLTLTRENRFVFMGGPEGPKDNYPQAPDQQEGAEVKKEGEAKEKAEMVDLTKAVEQEIKRIDNTQNILDGAVHKELQNMVKQRYEELRGKVDEVDMAAKIAKGIYDSAVKRREGMQ